MRHAATIVLLAATCLLARPDDGVSETTERPAFGYDHLLHEGKINVMGGAALACTSCHRVDKRGTLLGTPGHASCFGACHGAPPSRTTAKAKRRLAQAQRRVCTRCHAPDDIGAWQRGSKAKLKVFFPPYNLQRDYGITLSHKAHDGPSRAKGRATTGCITCHANPAATPAKPPRDVHARCASCHVGGNKSIPAMTACTACHRAAYGPASRPNLLTNAFSVGSQFSHKNHEPHLSGSQDCRTCHQSLADTAGIDLPTPKTGTCATCHDGTRAFSTTATRCSACHTQRDPKRQRTPPPRKRYSHERHKRRGASQACSDCHTLDSAGQPHTASRDHAPCSDAACHASDFVAAAPKTCGACHIAVEPWRALHHDRPPRAVTEFGARFSHKAHLGGTAPRITSDCSACHARRTGRRTRALPRRHDTCTAAGCHYGAEGAKPHLGQCTACHVMGALAQRSRTRASAQWSVRAQFRHDSHTARADKPDPRLACTACHSTMVQARGLATAPTPAKAACASCHDGAAAFKVTGQQCWRCHAQRRN